MLEVPQLAVEVELQAGEVAVAIAPDLARHAAALGERVAGGRSAVEIEAQHFAEVVVERLRRFALHPLARAEEQVLAVGRELDAMREVPRAGDLGRLAPDHLQPFDPAGVGFLAHQRALAERGVASLAFGGFGPAQVDRAPAERRGGFAFEEGDVAEPALAA